MARNQIFAAVLGGQAAKSQAALQGRAAPIASVCHAGIAGGQRLRRG